MTFFTRAAERRNTDPNCGVCAVVRKGPEAGANVHEGHHRHPLGGDVVANALCVAEASVGYRGVVGVTLHREYHRPPAGLNGAPHAAINLVIREARAG